MAAIGDDALILSGVWTRNHDMHAITDRHTRKLVNKPPMDTIIERHVWIGQNALLLHCTRVGAGTIIGSQSLVKGEVIACTAVGGTPPACCVPMSVGDEIRSACPMRNG